jgi:phosphopantothenoylcysteine decarboxylase/phosphopantothenate--cysteine ligase
MKSFLANKRVIVGITGGIAAYKSADLVRRLRESGAEIRVVMTAHAKEFITPLTLQAVSGHPVHDELFDLEAEAAMGHIELARWADVIIVAPATADFMARLAGAQANDLLTTLCLATIAPIAIAPAMNQAMWKNTLTQQNLQVLQAKGLHIFGPAEGSQACGDTGPGRMLESLDIVERISQLFATGLLAGKKVVITAGPTQEPIDPVRYLSNGSSGKMGYALAEAAVEAGASVVLISGPVHLLPPTRVRTIAVKTAQEMLEAVLKEVADADFFFGVAAVSDYRYKARSNQKIAKQDSLTLQLEKNPDIIAEVAALAVPPFIVGFAAETHDIIASAKSKMLKKRLNMIVANEVGEGKGIGCDENSVTFLWPEGDTHFPLMPKSRLARELIYFITQKQKETLCRIN